MHDTPLGPLASGVTLRQIGVRDRLRELDFEIPLAGGDLRGAAPDLSLSDVGELLRLHLPADDPLASYADRLMSRRAGRSVAARVLVGLDRRGVAAARAALSGGRLQDQLSGRYRGRLRFARLTEAMLHSDYPLQALLYVAVLHRFLRWRQPGYDPARHLGGVLYLFVRGMCGVDTRNRRAAVRGVQLGAAG